VVCRWPHRMLVIARNCRATSHTRAARFPIMAAVTAGRGHSPLKALLAPLVATFDALLGKWAVMSDDASLSLLRVASLLLYAG
jgi:heme A synthase